MPMIDLNHMKYSFEDFSTITICAGPIWHPSQDTLYFISNMHNTIQIYETSIIERYALWPKRLTYSKNRTTFPMTAKNGLIYHLTDEGGDENWQITELNPQTRETVFLTELIDRKHLLHIVTDSKLIFSANRTDKSRFDIYSYSILDKKIELLVESKVEGKLTCLDLSEDESLMLLQEYISINKVKFHIYDFNKNSSESVDATNQDVWENGTFITNTKILCLTNKNREFLSLAILDLETNDLIYLEEEDWDTEYYAYDKKTQVIAWVKNNEGYSKLFIAKLENNKLSDKKEITLFDKAVIVASDYRSSLTALSFNHSATRLAVCIGSGTLNLNIYVFDIENFEKVKYWKATNAEIGKIDPKIFVSESLHKIKSFDDLEFSTYLFTPIGPEQKKVPCVINIHGGPEGQARPVFDPLSQFLLYNGFAVAVPNVRGSAGYGKTFNTLDNVRLRLNSVKDIAALAKYLNSVPGIDGSKLIVYGGSYGGYMVLACVTEYPDLFCAGIDIVGISNFVTFLENTATWRRKLREVEYGSLERDREFLESISPIKKANLIKNPLLIIHGKNDERVPLSEALQMEETLKKNKIPVELLVFEDEGHGIVKTSNRTILFQKIFEFLETYGR